jgi:hypothetical protein
MHIARSIVERIGFAFLRLEAICITTAAVALIMASFALWATDAKALRIVSGDVFRLAVVFALAGSVTFYLDHTRTRWLRDGPLSEASAGSSFSGWLILFPLTLVSVPLLMLTRLRPLAEFWRDVLALADQIGPWQDLLRNSSASGLVLMPIIAALAVPAIEVLAAAAYVLDSTLLVALLLLRSTRVPRALLLCVLLQSSLVLASVVGAAVIERLTPSLEQLIRETPDPAGVEQARATDALQRYGVVTRGASDTLTWPCLAMAFWTPLILLTARSRVTFAAAGPLQGDPTFHASARIDPANVSAMDDQTRARSYVDAAQQIDKATRPSRWF